MVAMLGAAVTIVPALLDKTFKGAISAGAAATPSAASTAGMSTAAADCSHVTAAQITKAVGRQVELIAMPQKCTFGGRLDDSKTTWVTIEMKASHPAYDARYSTSAKQRRVVYGTGIDPSSKPATLLWIASGQPIITGKKPVVARADIEVMVASKALGLSDDRGRKVALAIATLANATP